MQHGMVGIDTQFSIQRLLVLNPDRGNATTAGTGDVGHKTVTDMNRLVSLTVGELEGFFKYRARWLLLWLLAADDDVIDMLSQIYALDLVFSPVCCSVSRSPSMNS